MSKDLIRRVSLSRNISMIQKGPQYLKQTSKKDILDILPSSLCDFFPTPRWSRWRPSLLFETSDHSSLFWPLFWHFFLRDPFISVLDLPLYSLSFSFFFLCFLRMTKEKNNDADYFQWSFIFFCVFSTNWHYN